MKHDLKLSYDKGRFLNLLDDLLPDFQPDEKPFNPGQKYLYFNDIVHLGTSKHLELKVFAINVDSGLNKRATITKDAFRLMKETANYRVLVAFYASNNPDRWRLSLLEAQPQIIDGKVKTSFSNPKRSSYVLGKLQKIGTPTKQLAGSQCVKDFNELRQRFALEVVNEEFYKSIAELYDELVGNDKQQGALILPDDEQDRDKICNFAIRLIGRVIFCWFLKEKRSLAGRPLLPEGILSSSALKKYPNYYDTVLKHLFFGILNTMHNQRQDKYFESPYKDIPYLNGGLFDPRHDYYYKHSNNNGAKKVVVSDRWLKQFLELLEMYNFTIDENTSYDIELSIDPEMLGRIFENLLDKINPDTQTSDRKETGSFYTPREIVEYMVDESLFHYLKDKTQINDSKLRALISYDPLDDEEYPLNKSEKMKVIDSLSSVQILDPACGSGAFPIGVLQKTVFILEQVDRNGKEWLEKQIVNSSPEFARHLKQEFRHKNFNYLRKMGIIRECIYGVDNQLVATEIARLRCFLTLMVEQSIDDGADNRGIHPLPNLDFKFVSADSLIPLFSNQTDNVLPIFDKHAKMQDWDHVRDYYFSSYNSERGDYRLAMSDMQREILDDIINGHYSAYLEETRKFARWQPFNQNVSQWFDAGAMLGVKDGFDIVIGNPPYRQLQKDGSKLANQYKDEGFDSFIRKGDIYQLFYERGITLLKQDGILCYITSNKWMRADYGRTSRRFFANNAKVIRLIDLGPNRFQAATVDTNILILKKTNNTNIASKALTMVKSDLFNAEIIERTGYPFAVPHQGKPWLILSPMEKKIQQKIEKIGTPLKEWDINIYRGILTGYNDAFIIDNETKERLVAEDPKSIEILKPLLRGRDIKRYRADWQNLWLISTMPSLEIDIESYPAIKRHLLGFGQDRLEQTGRTLDSGIKSRKQTGHKWFELQDSCAYHEEFVRNKIIYQEIVHRSPAFFYDDNKGYYVEASAFLMTGSNLGYILLFLNSQLGYYFFRTFYSGGGLGNQGIRYKKHYLEQMHIPQIGPSALKAASALLDEALSAQNQGASQVKRIHQDVNRFFYSLCNFTEEEVQHLEQCLDSDS